jgi:transcriptional regulator with XRE-family HTH domain
MRFSISSNVDALRVSQRVFAEILGTSPSTIHSWEQGQKPPSPMARRFLGLIAADLPFWKRQFRAIVQMCGREKEQHSH